jgi:ABC-type transporter Mla subunit MlaD
MDLETRIRARIEALTKQREQVVAAANQQIAALSGAIKELEALVAEQDGDKQEPDKEA